MLLFRGFTSSISVAASKPSGFDALQQLTYSTVGGFAEQLGIADSLAGQGLCTPGRLDGYGTVSDRPS
jgi:hypothetical protein